ncbi:hypothetical protein [Nitrosomonas sp.]|uniref:hypothetical protein n=1 Tax=Nitrosomonas sp. TaxID=42353 RepID=UPI0025EEF25B|nr:hypothetical protein [Nitrosomonas sp.]
MPTVIEILKQHLVDNEFDGLVNGYAECGCDVSDLVPCDSNFSECKPAYKYRDPSNENEFLFFAEKQEELQEELK